MNDPQTAGDAGTPSPAEPPPSQASVRDHLANERTLLAWIRTALTIIGLGFIVGRLLAEDGGPHLFLTAASVILVVVGGLASLLAARQFLLIERQIDSGDFRPSSGLDVALAGGVSVAAVVLAISLVLGR